MIYYFFALMSFSLAIIPIRINLLGRLLAIFSGSSSLLYGLVRDDSEAFPDLSIMSAYLSSNPFGSNAALSLSLMSFVLALSAALTGQAEPRVAVNRRIGKGVAPAAWYGLIIVTTIAPTVEIAWVGLPMVWSYPGYGALTDYFQIEADPISRFVVAAGRPFAFVLIGLTVMGWVNRERMRTLIAVLPLSLNFIVSFAESSRVSAVFLIFAASCLYLANKYVISAMFIILGLFVFLGVIEARNHTEIGIGHQFQYMFETIFNIDSYMGLFQNLFNGTLLMDAAANTAAGNAYSTSYKILSFLPSISAIDGFSRILLTDEQRINPAIPFSAFAEAWQFGISYFLFLFLILYLAAYCVNKSIRYGRAFSFLLLGIFMLGWTQVSQYPVRNTIRFFYVIIIIYSCVSFFRSGAANLWSMRRQPPVRRQMLR